MRQSSKRPRSIAALLLCGLLLALCCDADPAAAFGMFGFGGHFGGGFARPAPGGGQFGRMPPPNAGGGGGMVGRPPGRGFTPPPMSGGGPIIGPGGGPPGGGPPSGGPPGNAVTGGGGGRNTGGNSNNNNAGATPPQQNADQAFAPDEVITALAAGATPQAINALAQRNGLTQLETQNFPLIGVSLYRWRIGANRSVASTIQALGRENLVASVQPNYFFILQEEPAKAPSAAANPAPQYVLEKLQVEEAHKIATGKDVLVAVIDSQIDAKNDDLAGAVVKSFDATTPASAPHAHGTSIAGAIAAHGRQLEGIAPGAQILAIHAFDDTPGVARGLSFSIYKGLQWAADNGARVINMSFAGPSDPTLAKLLAAAYGKGIVLIAAAGNAGPQAPPPFPAADPDVIAVTATDANDALFAMANRGRYLAVAAPGVDILALAPDDKVQFSTGTSIAAAHVSGIAALLIERKPALKPADIRATLIATAKPLGPPKPDSEFGAGLANAYRALTPVDRKPAEPDAANAQAKQ